MINRNSAVQLPILKYLTPESSLCILHNYRKLSIYLNISPKIQLERRGRQFWNDLSLWNNKPESSTMKFMCLMILTIAYCYSRGIFIVPNWGKDIEMGIFILAKLLINFVGFYVLIIILNTCIWLAAILFYATIHIPRSGLTVGTKIDVVFYF